MRLWIVLFMVLAQSGAAQVVPPPPPLESDSLTRIVLPIFERFPSSEWSFRREFGPPDTESESDGPSGGTITALVYTHPGVAARFFEGSLFELFVMDAALIPSSSALRIGMPLEDAHAILGTPIPSDVGPPYWRNRRFLAWLYGSESMGVVGVFITFSAGCCYPVPSGPPNRDDEP